MKMLNESIMAMKSIMAMRTRENCHKSAKLAFAALLTFGTTLCAQTNGTSPSRDVPAGCDPNVMSEKYWGIWSDNALAEIDRDIEKYRKGDFCEKIVDDSRFGDVLPDGTVVSVEQISHAFRFGAHDFMVGRLATTDINRRYEEHFVRLFNQITMGIYWRGFELVPGQPHFHTSSADLESAFTSGERDKMTPHERYFASPRRSVDQSLEFARAHGMTVHGHPLVWGSDEWMVPFWLYEQYCPQEEKDFLRLPLKDQERFFRLFAEKDWLKAYRDRMSEIHERYTEEELAAKCPVYLAIMKNRWARRIAEVLDYCGDNVDSWDVVNESMWDWVRYKSVKTGKTVCKSVYGLMPGDYALDSFLLAEKHVSSKVLLSINDYVGTAQYAEQIDDLLSNGARVDMVGMQFHIFSDHEFEDLVAGAEAVRGKLCPITPEGIRSQFKIIGRSGRPVHLSEITIPAPGMTKRSMQQQAIAAANLYRCWFSQPNAYGITWWHTYDGANASGGIESGSSGVMDCNAQPKPVYYALYDLIHRKWKTKVNVVAKDGMISFRGFRGRYRLAWRDADGKVRVKFVEIK